MSTTSELVEKVYSLEDDMEKLRTELLECEKLRDEYKNELLLSQAREIKLREALLAAKPYVNDDVRAVIYAKDNIAEAQNTIRAALVTPEPPLLGVLEKVREALKYVDARLEHMEMPYANQSSDVTREALTLLDSFVGNGNYE